MSSFIAFIPHILPYRLKSNKIINNYGTIHLSTKPQHSENSPSSSYTRRTFLSTLATITTTLSLTDTITNPMETQAATNRGLVPGAAEQALQSAIFSFPSTWPYTSTDFTRFDPNPDSIFYSQPRLTQHIDEKSVKRLRDFYETFLLSNANVNDILDVCSSVESYLPDRPPNSSYPNLKRVAALGMNNQELESNPSLSSSDYIVHDLNSDPTVPYSTNSFDAILCALSIDYLTQPLQVCKEFGRVLKPGGFLVISFGDRVFADKAITVWMNGGNIDHIYLVSSYLFYSQLFDIDTIQIHDITPRRFRSAIIADPIYVITAQRIVETLS